MYLIIPIIKVNKSINCEQEPHRADILGNLGIHKIRPLPIPNIERHKSDDDDSMII